MNNDVIAEHVEAWIQSHAGVSGSTAPQAPAAPENESGKTLVVYYSATGSTEAVAGYIANATDGDTFAITPSEPYSSADLNWTDSESRVSREHNDPSKQDVKLAKNTVDNWADYDTAFIGYPFWWSNAAWPVNDFVKNNDFTGKTVIPFCTSTSSGLGQSGELLKEMEATGNWQEGRRFSERVSQSDITAWVYLPYGYSADQQYNILYLSHGGWSNEETLMGTPDSPHAFKHIVDHAIEDGKIQPLVIVLPTYNNTSESDSGSYSLALRLTSNFHNELVNDLLPAVESKYSTYAESTDRLGLAASRDHRAFGGFSMGSMNTWRTFEHCLDYFRYFAPSSGGPIGDGEYMANIVRNSGHSVSDFFIFAASGTEDFAYSGFKSGVMAMGERYFHFCGQ